MKIASRISQVPPYPFVEISRKIAAKKAQGIDVISFGIGDPDIPTPGGILDELHAASVEPPNHRYPESEGLPEFREAVADWYERRFGVRLDPETEVLSLIGAKEGIGHAALAFVEPGDVALVPDPGYPVYSVGTLFAGGESHTMPLLESNGWWPDLDAVSAEVAQKATVMWLNYPNNPTGATAELHQFEKAIAFARRHQIAVMHDACYSEVAYDGYRPVSFLQAGGAREVGLEFHSLSKTHSMTGWRLGMAVGNADMIEALRVIKSNLDSGVPQAIQRMGIAALSGPLDSMQVRNDIYQGRRDLLVNVLKAMGLDVQHPRASLYVWAAVPDGYTSADFAERLLEERDVLVSPGTSYGDYGEGYVRLSLTLPDEQLEQAVDRLATWTLPEPRR
jgi:LL-diaminopimelate aminotransferase